MEQKKNLIKYMGNPKEPLNYKNYTIKRKWIKIDTKYTIFNFQKANDFNFWVKEYYMKTADDVKILKNIFKNDKTVNYEVKYNTDRIEDIFNFHLLNNYNNFFAIKEKLVSDLVDIMCREKFYNKMLINIKKEKEILEELKKYFNYNEEKMLNELYTKYMKKTETYNEWTEVLCWNYREKNFKNTMIAVEKGYEKKDNIIRKMLGLESNAKLKNTSELTLYKIIKDSYNDAIYQYKTTWLNKQSIDIYIPTLKIGIEYQGEQHYKPINVFGGKEQFEKQKYLDNKKRKLCLENGVYLIEWKYNEPITPENLTRKIKQKP